MPRPQAHPCTVGTLDYSAVVVGVIVCAPEKGGCGRRWQLGNWYTAKGKPWRGWRMTPFARQMPRPS